jgi:8-oxo-dGTP pyrophosphatase MutT (NUDIX family)
VTAGLDLARRHVVAGSPAAVRDRILAFVDAHDDALHRSCAPGHLTGSAMVVDGRRTRALLLHHRKLGRWLQPGGHADGDGDLARVALREATEETGIDGLVLASPLPVDLDVHEVRPPGEAAHLHLDVRYLVIAPDGAEAIGNHESTALRWVPLVDLLDADEDGMRRLAAAALSGPTLEP